MMSIVTVTSKDQFITKQSTKNTAIVIHDKTEIQYIFQQQIIKHKFNEKSLVALQKKIKFKSIRYHHGTLYTLADFDNNEETE